MSNPTRPPGLPVKILWIFCNTIAWLAAALVALWSFGALWFDLPPVLQPKIWAVAWLVLVVAACVWLRPCWRARLGIGLAFLLILVWWLSLKPQQFRSWKPEVSQTARAEINGDAITIHGVRNFEYRSEADFTPRWETRTVHLANLRGVDLFLNYWGSPHMAHPVLSYDFGPEGRICFSIETRPETGESYSALGGLYRQFELCYVVADERDVVRVRTNFRQGEDVYLYRLRSKKARESFLEYIHSINELAQSPRWYNAITNNCTTAIRHQRSATDRAPWDWRMLANGHCDELLYEFGAIDRSLPFQEARERARINDKARAANDDPAFSERIRDGLPGM